MNMKKNRTILFLVALILVSSVMACSMFGGSNSNSNSTTNSVANSNAPASTAVPAADCPKSAIPVSEAKNGGLAKYQGCLLSVRGKTWEITNETITLIDANDRTDYNGALYIGGNFAGGQYSDIALRLSKLKIDQQLDRLPVATFAGSVETNGGYTTLKNSILTDVQR